MKKLISNLKNIQALMYTFLSKKYVYVVVYENMSTNKLSLHKELKTNVIEWYNDGKIEVNQDPDYYSEYATSYLFNGKLTTYKLFKYLEETI